MIIKVNNFEEALIALEVHKSKLADVGYDIADGILQDEARIEIAQMPLLCKAYESLDYSLKRTAEEDGWEYIPVYLTFEESGFIHIYAVGIIIQHEYNKAEVEAKVKEAKLREQEGEHDET